VTARRERRREKEKREKERTILGGKACTGLGCLGGGAGDSPVAAEHPGPSAGWSLVTQQGFPGGPGQEMRRSCLPFARGAGPFTCISKKK